MTDANKQAETSRESPPLLERIVPAMAFKNALLTGILPRVFEAVDGEFSMNADALGAAAVGIDRPVTIAFDEGPLGDVLARILAAASGDGPALDFVDVGGAVLVTTRAAAREMLGLETRAYGVTDFFATADLPEHLRESADESPPKRRMAAYLESLADANPLGQSGRVMTGAVVDGDRVVITHTPAFHLIVGGWLAGLRQARFAAPSSAADVYRIAAMLRARECGADAVLALLDGHPGDPLTEQLLAAVLGEHGAVEGPPPSVEVVMTTARQRLDAAGARATMLAARLDETLLALMAGGDLPNGDATSPLRLDEHGITVSVLVDDANAATVLAQSGLAIEATVDSANVVVGVAPLSRLADLAVLPGVRRVEATRQ